jgi:hypothetical protein
MKKTAYITVSCFVLFTLAASLSNFSVAQPVRTPPERTIVRVVPESAYRPQSYYCPPGTVIRYEVWDVPTGTLVAWQYNQPYFEFPGLWDTGRFGGRIVRLRVSDGAILTVTPPDPFVSRPLFADQIPTTPRTRINRAYIDCSRLWTAI